MSDEDERDAVTAWLERARSAPKVDATEWGSLKRNEARPLFPGYAKEPSAPEPPPQKLALSKAPSLPPVRIRPPSIDIAIPPMPRVPSIRPSAVPAVPEIMPVIEPPMPAGPDPEVVALRAAFAEAALALATAREQVMKDAEETLVSLAFEIAEAIVGDAIAREPKYHRALARTALEALDLREGTARLRVSRESWDALVDVYGSARIDEGGRRAELVLDPALEGLGCVAESGEARVDGRVATRLASVRKEFAEVARVASDRPEGEPIA